ncbi:MAG: ATP-binding cassette domain-containing protein [Cellulosilyticaceae bacterium]
MLKKLLHTWPWMVASVILTMALGFLESFMLVKMVGLFDLALSGSMVGYKEKGMQIILLAILLIPLAMVVTVVKNSYKQKANVAMKTYYIEKVYGKNMNEFNGENNSKYVSCLANDFNTLETKLIDALYMFIDGGVYFLSAIWMMYTVEPFFIFIGLGVMALNMTISAVTSKPIRKQMNLRSDAFEDYTGTIKETLGAFHIIKNNDLYDHVGKQFYDKSEKIQHKGYLIDRMITYVACLQNTEGMLTIMGVMLLAGYLTLKGYGTIGGVLILFDAMHRVVGPTYMMSEAMPQLLSVKDLCKKIETTLENVDKQEEALSLEGIEEQIVFKDVSFGYDEDVILEEVNMTLKKGGKYLLIGPSGGGKSTCLKLLRKYFNPQEGGIFVDGKPLKDIKKASYFQHIANVEQKVFIFEDTLRNNLTLYKDYTDETIWEAVEKAGLKDFVAQDTAGLDRMLYDNGKNISGGEKSRIAIARGLLEKADMLLIDEGFAALDSERAREIEKSLLDLRDMTVVHVSHVLFKEHQALYDGIYVVKDKGVTLLPTA